MSLGHGASIVKNGLVLHLDAANVKSYTGTGTAWNDLSSNGNNGTLVNSPTFNSSTNNGSFLFNGTNQSVTFNSNVNLQFLGTAPYTLEAWFNPSVLPGVNSYKGIINRESSAGPGGTRDGYNLWFNTSSGTNTMIATERICAGVFGGASVLYDSSLTVNKWTHVIATYTGSAVFLYINGSQVATNNVTGSISNTTKTLEVANRNGAFINANIPYVSIYDRALTATEVRQNFNALRGRYGL